MAKEVNVKNYTLPIGERTIIMGVLNVTPDSFSDSGMYIDPEKACQRAVEMQKEGADIIDIGGESSRPGSKKITASEELERVLPVLERVMGCISVPVSVDTYKSRVAFEALSRGVSFINDITALNGDPEMARVISDFDAGVMLMHMKGEPEFMQENPHYEDLIGEMITYLEKAISVAEKSGIDPGKIIVDPGFGFGKDTGHNLAILKNLKSFKKLGKPLLVGTSRKSFIGALTGENAGERVYGTASSVAIAIMSGADIVRVHDVLAMKKVALVADAVNARGII
jgi:dihydropteroate synthase